MKKPKICHLIFSTNRLEFLVPSLQSIHNLVFSGCDVDRIIVDDYPLTRNDDEFTKLVSNYGFNEIILHKENLGLTVTWTNMWNKLKNMDYDYIFHQEDDVIFLEPVKIIDLINLLEVENNVSQIQLTRQEWYPTDIPPGITKKDCLYKDYRYTRDSLYFNTMASLCSSKILNMNIFESISSNLSEGLVGGYLANEYNMYPIKLKRYSDGGPLINHIGEWFVGKRTVPGDPGHEYFSMYNPDKKYSSRTGELYSV